MVATDVVRRHVADEAIVLPVLCLADSGPLYCSLDNRDGVYHRMGDGQLEAHTGNNLQQRLRRSWLTVGCDCGGAQKGSREELHLFFLSGLSGCPRVI